MNRACLGEGITLDVAKRVWLLKNIFILRENKKAIVYFAANTNNPQTSFAKVIFF